MVNRNLNLYATQSLTHTHIYTHVTESQSLPTQIPDKEISIQASHRNDLIDDAQWSQTTVQEPLPFGFNIYTIYIL